MRPRPNLSLPFFFPALAAIAAGAVLLLPARLLADAPALQVTNHANGETIRYPVPLLYGTLADRAATELTVTNTTSTRPTRVMKALAFEGRFKALAELVPGENKLVLRAGAATLPFTIVYKPQTNPYIVRAVYFTDNTGATDFQTPISDDPQDFRGKLDTAMKIMQTFCAERLHDLGYGRQTFNLELDANGKIQVHVLRGDKPASHYQTLDGGQLYGELNEELNRKLPHPTARNLVIPAFTRFDPATRRALAHTALGGGNQALFGGGDLFVWPNTLADVQPTFMNATRVDPKKVFSDSVGRDTYWAIASTTIGAAQHELGHTFGLPHSTEVHDIMTRGHDRFNRVFTLIEPQHAYQPQPYRFKDNEIACWAPVSAEALLASRYFALDARQWSDENKTAFRLDTKRRCIAVESDNRLRFVGLYRYDAGGSEMLYRVPLSLTAPPRAVSIPLLEIGRRLATPNVGFTVIDGQGLTSGTRIADLLRGPFVQAWQFAPATRPWKNTNALVQLAPDDIAAIERSAAAAELTRSRGECVDFVQLYPGKEKEYVAGYALRTIHSDKARKVRILTGSDDSLRVWVNGKLVTEALALRGAVADSDTGTAELRPGDNRLLAEVSNGEGDWALYLRLEDEDGTKLELSDKGELQPISADTDREIAALLAGPFVRKWQFATTTLPWNDKRAFVTLSDEDLRRITAEALKADLTGNTGGAPAVDFLKHFPPDRQNNVTGYVARIIRADKPMRVKLYTGSDDALRMWLNGKLITQVLALRGAKADSECTEADLKAGENTLVAEVSQAGGDWGLILRIADDKGADLLLGDDGKLAPAG